MAVIFNLPRFSASDNNGNPLASGKLNTYLTGSSTPATTYQDEAGGIPNANPIILSSRGEATVWLTVGTKYRFVLTDSADTVIWTEDGVQGGGTSSVADLTFTGTGGRINADFSNATHASRILFKSSTTNGVTQVGAIPNGTGATGGFVGYSAADASNASYVAVLADNSSNTSRIDSNKTGTGTSRALAFQIGGTTQWSIDASGRWLNSANSQPGFDAVKNADQTTVSTGTDITFQTENFDYGGVFASPTFTAPVAGIYQISAQVWCVGTANQVIEHGVIKNGTTFVVAGRQQVPASGSTNVSIPLTKTVLLAANDTLKVQCFAGTSHTVSQTTNSYGTYFSVRLIG